MSLTACHLEQSGLMTVSTICYIIGTLHTLDSQPSGELGAERHLGVYEDLLRNSVQEFGLGRE